MDFDGRGVADSFGRQSMSHSLSGPHGTSFNYNSDLSGELTIHRGDNAITVPARDVVWFVGAVVQNEKIRSIEDKTPFEILGLEIERP